MIGSEIGKLMQRLDVNTCHSWDISCDWYAVYTVTLRGENGELTMSGPVHLLDTLLENALDAWEHQHPKRKVKPE